LLPLRLEWVRRGRDRGPFRLSFRCGPPPAAERRLTQAETARVLGTTQPKVSDLFAGKLAGFSMDRLIRFLKALDRDVQIVVTPKRHGESRARTLVVGAPA